MKELVVSFIDMFKLPQRFRGQRLFKFTGLVLPGQIDFQATATGKIAVKFREILNPKTL